MSLRTFFTTTHASRADIAAPSVADELLPNASERWVRCVDIDARPETVYRWLCQLTVAPYSFDIIDQPGRRSPEQLIDGADRLEIGQHFMIFELVRFKAEEYIAGMSRPEFRAPYGTLSVSYQVVPRAGGTRLRANACLGSTLPAWRRWLLGIGDYVMAGRQLQRLKRLSERSERRGEV